jgi:hypothetical protein
MALQAKSASFAVAADISLRGVAMVIFKTIGRNSLPEQSSRSG